MSLSPKHPLMPMSCPVQWACPLSATHPVLNGVKQSVWSGEGLWTESIDCLSIIFPPFLLNRQSELGYHTCAEAEIAQNQKQSG